MSGLSLTDKGSLAFLYNVKKGTSELKESKVSLSSLSGLKTGKAGASKKHHYIYPEVKLNFTIFDLSAVISKEEPKVTEVKKSKFIIKEEPKAEEVKEEPKVTEVKKSKFIIKEEEVKEEKKVKFSIRKEPKELSEAKEEKEVKTEAKRKVAISKRTGYKILPAMTEKITLFKVPPKPFITPKEAGLVQLPTADLVFKISDGDISTRSSLAVATTKAETSKRDIINSIDISRLNSGKKTATRLYYTTTELSKFAKNLQIPTSGSKKERILRILDEIIKHGDVKQRKEAEKRKAEEL